MLKNVNIIAAQTQLDAQRFIYLGAEPEKVKVVGNIKFDITIPEGLFDKAKELRATLGADRNIWIAGSTHQGEEEKILQAHQKIKQLLPNTLLILVPRHPERFSEVAELSKQYGFNVIRRSEQKVGVQYLEPASKTDILIGDAMGELLLFYAASDVAVVCGSLMPGIGGHNLLEPAALNIPVISGIYLDNCLEISQLLENAEALIKVNNSEELANAVIKLLQDSLLRKKQSAAGFSVVAQNRGVLEKLIDLISSYL